MRQGKPPGSAGGKSGYCSRSKDGRRARLGFGFRVAKVRLGARPIASNPIKEPDASGATPDGRMQSFARLRIRLAARRQALSPRARGEAPGYVRLARR